MNGASSTEILAELSARIRRHERDGRPEAVLDQPAHERAVALSSTVLADRASRSDPATVRILGEWFRRRHLELPVGSGQADLRRARTFAGLLRDLGDPTLVDRLVDVAGERHLAERTEETALALLDEFDATGDERRVATARVLIGTLEETLPPDHPLRGRLSYAGGQLSATLFVIHGDPGHRDETVRVLRASLASAEPGRAHTTDETVLLAHALLTRYDDHGKPADLDEARDLAERVLAERPAEWLPNAVDVLAGSLRRRYERTRRVSDLDRAIELCRNAILGTPSGHPVLLPLRRSLLLCLIRRVGDLGQDSDLTEAIDIARTIRSALGPAGPLRCETLASLSVLLVWQFGRTGAEENLTEAAGLSREAVALSENLHGLRASVLVNHASILGLTFLVARRPADLAEAIGACRDAIATNPRNAVRLGVVRSMLIRLLTIQGQAAHLREALDTGHASVSLFGPGHPGRADALTDLARAYQQRHELTGDRGDLDTAVGLWRSAVHSPTARPGVRMRAAEDWRTALLRADELNAAAEPAKAQVDLLPVLAWRGLDRTGRERRLAGLGTVATTAAALAVELGRPESAVELVEQGRSVLWTQAIQTRSDLSALYAAAPSLAAELDGIRAELDRRFVIEHGIDGDGDRSAHAYRKLVERWETLVADARAVPGFADFLGATPFDALRAAAAGGAVVIVNVARPRCDALIVRRDGVRTVPLPWLTLDSARRRATGLLDAIAETEAGGARTHLRHTLTSLLRWLWDVVAAPVLAALDAGEPGRSAPHRVWWCPTGPLTLLPLHAAGRYGRAEPRRRPTVPDRTVSSYTTGLGALLRTGAAAPSTAEPTVVAVGMPHTPGMADLPSVPAELDHVAGAVPGAHTLVGPAATPDAVLAELGRHRWAHFACHATQHVAEPSRSALHLAGGDLPVWRLAALDLAGADLAYLSACRTAGGSMDLADEAINLAAALQLAGYRNVVATLWPVADRHATTVAKAVYETTIGPGRTAADCASALRSTTGALREQHPDRPDIWAPFIHLGSSAGELATKPVR